MNVSSLKTPGVYINEVDAFPPSIAQVATAIPAFVGFTEKGPIDPTRISSLMEFEKIFGGAPPPDGVDVFLDTNNLPTDESTVTDSKYKLYNSMKLFYTNGGGVCYIVTIGNFTDSFTKTKFKTGLDKLRQFDEPTLLLFPDAINLAAADLGEVQAWALTQCADLMDRFTIMDLKDASFSGFRTNVGNQNLKYGSAYYPDLKCNLPNKFRFSDINGTTLGKIDFATIYSSDTVITQNLTDYNTVMADVNATEEDKILAEKTLTDSIPIYQTIIDKLSTSINIVPPSGAIAGIYAQTDKTRGVWKSPANISISGIIGLTADINDKDQEDMNVHDTGKSINALRKFTGKGFMVWGGRTLAGNSNDWRYVNVRRLAIMIEESVKKACSQFVFEPNVAQTWVSVKGMIDNYLTTLWNDGALAGAKPEHAFFVQVGLGQTMTSDDINNGRLIVKIGYAPSKPAEFIILEFKQMQQKS
jgi:uncharacterized protein